MSSAIKSSSNAAVDVANLRLWLKSVGLEKHIEVLLKGGYNSLDRVANITLDELSAIGISTLGCRRRFLVALNDLAPAFAATDNDSFIKSTSLCINSSAKSSSKSSNFFQSNGAKSNSNLFSAATRDISDHQELEILRLKSELESTLQLLRERDATISLLTDRMSSSHLKEVDKNFKLSTADSSSGIKATTKTGESSGSNDVVASFTCPNCNHITSQQIGISKGTNGETIACFQPIPEEESVLFFSSNLASATLASAVIALVAEVVAIPADEKFVVEKKVLQPLYQQLEAENAELGVIWQEADQLLVFEQDDSLNSDYPPELVIRRRSMEVDVDHFRRAICERLRLYGSPADLASIRHAETPRYNLHELPPTDYKQLLEDQHADSKKKKKKIGNWIYSISALCG